MRVDWSGAGVKVETTAGIAAARAAIVTLPTNVLASGAVAFAPALPVPVLEAIAACPCGHAEKVVLRLDRPLEGFDGTSYIDTFDPDRPDRPPINFVVNPSGEPLAVGQLGGPTAAALEAAGPEAMVDFAVAALVDAFGADVRRRVVASAVTRWASDADIRGAYSCALPGMAHLRAHLSETIGERILFAGEAVPLDTFSTAHGAHLSGIAAANRAAAMLGTEALRAGA
jgi:monoamine oxidase